MKPLYKIRHAETGKFVGGTYVYTRYDNVGRTWEDLKTLKSFIKRCQARRLQMSAYAGDQEYYNKQYDFDNWRVVQVEITTVASQTIGEFYDANQKRGSKRASAASASAE